uniref:Disease resistance protein At4g27190-like leucine-rich repeats domain-containing protein n=1 Tax=Saccharum hybrid cultivar R570 TaxID=131158 RepID=A0A059Q2M0_9POAL|nr:hypothetical protein SHCRBa_185_O22_F_140 [Saccharum hybrid cultivar R570]
MKAILPRASSLFVALEKSDNPQGFPSGFLKHCSNLGVLILSHCAFSFVSPPFLWCLRLRFLGLDHCTYDNTSEGENNNTNWTWLQNLWVLGLRYTEWDDILSEEKMDNMDNLRELNIEGFMCWQLATRLHGKLPYLRSLRIIKPMHKADTSIDSSSSLFVDKTTELEILDLSGNRDMINLSISSSMARSLQTLILDGCDGLENVVVHDGLPSSLRSFSFDGYGSATRWTSSSFKLPPESSEQRHTSDADTSAVKTSKISLQGCTQLENLFVSGLPNLEELDEMLEPSIQQHHGEVIMYGDAFFKMDDGRMLFFPQPPTHPLDRHIEISEGSCGLESDELARNAGLSLMISGFAQSLHVHDASISGSMSAGDMYLLKWCRMERCPNLDTVFSAEPGGGEKLLQTIWVSHLLMARCILSKGSRSWSSYSFESLQHLHLRSCPRLRFVLPVWVRSFPSLETLHIIHCGDLTHVFVLDNKYPTEIVFQGLLFPKLTTIHLHDLPKLQQICEVKMLAPTLETIRIRGCFGLRRLPTVAAREPGVKKPTVEVEKDVWDSLEWDGLAADHHPDLFEPPVHSRYYRRSRHLRGTMLR